jgi:hypothetical protein
MWRLRKPAMALPGRQGSQAEDVVRSVSKSGFVASALQEFSVSFMQIYADSQLL